MKACDSQGLLQHIRRLAGDSGGQASDGALLRSYLQGRDEAAFAALVRRHGILVFSVCQSVLRQRDDAEDAFQATFLILARKAASIHQQEGLGGWLQRVAYRVALRARAGNAHRQERQAKAIPVEAGPASCDDLSWGEVRAILHAELAALPEAFRAPLVLCYLEGMTQEEAAQQLGWTAATVKGRLQRGRDKLRRRLERRGVGLTAALAAALTGQALAEPAARAARSFSVETASAGAAALARGFLRPWPLFKLLALAALLTPVGLLAGGMRMAAPSPEEPGPPAASAEMPEERSPPPQPGFDAQGDPLPEGAIARLGTVRFNHGEMLRHLFFSPDSRTILSVGGGIRIWDADTGKEQKCVPGIRDFLSDVQANLLPNGKTLIILHEGSGSDVACMWDLARERETRTLKLPVGRMVFSSYHENAISPDGKLALLHVHTPASAQVFDLTTGKHLYRLGEEKREWLAVAFAGSDRIVSSDQGHCIYLWEARTGKLLRRLTCTTPMRYLLASPDGRWLASLQERPSPYGRSHPIEEESVILWDLQTGAVKHSLGAGAKQQLSRICFSPDGKSLFTASWSLHAGKRLALWDCSTGRRLVALDSSSGIDADVVAISPDGSRLAAGSRAGKFELWDLEKGRQLSSPDSKYTQAVGVFLTPGERAVVVGFDFLSLWDATSGRRLHSLELPPYSGNLGVSSDGRFAVTTQIGEQERFLLVWDLVARRRLHRIQVPSGYKQITAAAFAPDAPVLATRLEGKQARVCLWDVRSGKLVRSFAETTAGWPGRLAFSADGKTLFVAGKHVAAYDVSRGELIFSWRLKPRGAPQVQSAPVGGAPMSPDDQLGWQTLAVASDGQLIAATPAPYTFARGGREDGILWYEARSGKLLRLSQDPSRPIGSVKHLAFSPDDQLLASSNGEVVRLWEAATGKAIASFHGHRGAVSSLSFSRDGRRLASAASDSTVLIWDLTGQQEKASPLAEAQLQARWDDLAADDAARAHRAVWTLLRAPRQSVAFLKEHLHPVPPVDRGQLERWIDDLDADALAARQRASSELEKLGELAEPSLRRRLEGGPPLEQRRRIELLLARLEAATPCGETLRATRAVRVLEHAATPEARGLLRQLARGAEGAWLTRAARAALRRKVLFPTSG